MLKIVYIIFWTFFIFNKLNSKSIESFYYEKEINNIPDSILVRLAKLDEDVFVSSDYSHKDVKYFSNEYFLSIWPEFNEQLYNTDTCFKYFDSCFCIFDINPINEALIRGFHRYLNNREYDIEKELLKSLPDCLEFEKEFYERAVADSIDGVYIPKDLNEAVEILIQTLPEERLKKMRSMSEDSVIGYEHHNLGMYIRNSWGLWANSRLNNYFKDTYGIYHPDSMSAIIILVLHRKLNDIIIDLDGIIEENQQKEEKYFESD